MSRLILGVRLVETDPKDMARAARSVDSEDGPASIVWFEAPRRGPITLFDNPTRLDAPCPGNPFAQRTFDQTKPRQSVTPRPNEANFNRARNEPTAICNADANRTQSGVVRETKPRQSVTTRPNEANSEPCAKRSHTPDDFRSLRRPETLARILEVPTVRRLPAWVDGRDHGALRRRLRRILEHPRRRHRGHPDPVRPRRVPGVSAPLRAPRPPG